MLYVHQSLGPDEEIIAEARFHWMYTVHAALWIIFGITAGIAVGYGAIWWDVTSTIRDYYPGLPDKLFHEAWKSVVDQKGGYLQLLWSLHPSIRFSILGSMCLGVFMFLGLMITKATTEIAVTSSRLIYKKGLVARNVGELNVDRIEGVSVVQGVWGRVFGYGRLWARGMGVGEILLPPIEDPLGFRKKIYEARKSQEEHDKTEAQDYKEDF